MVFPRGGVFGAARFWAAGIVIGSSALASTGCSLLPTTDDIRTATVAVKDTVTGKARKDKLNKTYAEARILERRKDYVQAERLYRELLVAEPKSRDCFHRLGVIAAVQGKYAEAHQNYQIALGCSQPTPDLWSDIGYCHYLQQQLPAAEQAFRSALTLDPQHAAATNNLALVVGEQGRLDEAYDLFRKVNGEAEAECNFAYLCAQSGDLPAAQAHFSRALSINPDMRVAAEALLQVTQSMQRRQDEARARLTQLAQQANQPQQPNSQQAAPQNPAAASAIVQAGYSQPVVAGAGVAQAGGYGQAATAQLGGAQPATNAVDPETANRAARILAAAPQQRLIEVYRAGPRTAAGNTSLASAAPGSSPSANVQASHEATSNQAAAPGQVFPATGTPPIPVANQGAWGNALAAASGPAVQPNIPAAATPEPFSFTAAPSPQYLQPSSQSRMPTKDASGNAAAASGNAGPATLNNVGQSNTVGRQNGRLLAPAARPSVLSFPQPN